MGLLDGLPNYLSGLLQPANSAGSYLGGLLGSGASQQSAPPSSGFLSGLLGTPQQWQSARDFNNSDPVGSGIVNYYNDQKAAMDALPPKQRMAQQAISLGMGDAGIDSGGITAFHGSPFKFSNFDMAKLGTGEGNQAFGQGLYLAEHPDVAKTYGPNLYKVKINARPHEMLDWEAPALSQPAASKLNDAHPDLMDNALGTQFGIWPDSGVSSAQIAALKGRVSGASLYQAAAEKFGSEAAAVAAMKAAGIKGVKYLDQFSRDKGFGTSNYAVFDPSLLSVIPH